MGVDLAAGNLRTPVHRRKAREALYRQCAQRVVDAFADVAYYHEAHKAADELEAEAAELRLTIARCQAAILDKRQGSPTPSLQIKTLQVLLEGVQAMQQELRGIEPPDLALLRAVLSKVRE